MTTTLDDEPTIAEVLAILDDDVVRLLDTTAGALVTHRDVTDSDQEDKREALAMASDLLAQAWANTRRAAEIIRADVPIDLVPAAPPRMKVRRMCGMWCVIDPTLNPERLGTIVAAGGGTLADAMNAAMKYARRDAA